MQIEITELQAEMLQEALSCYQAILMGRLTKATEPLIREIDFEEHPFKMQDTWDLIVALGGLDADITGHRNGGPSIVNPKVSNKARLARIVQLKLTGDSRGYYNEDGTVSREGDL